MELECLLHSKMLGKCREPVCFGASAATQDQLPTFLFSFISNTCGHCHIAITISTTDIAALFFFIYTLTNCLIFFVVLEFMSDAKYRKSNNL